MTSATWRRLKASSSAFLACILFILPVTALAQFVQDSDEAVRITVRVVPRIGAFLEDAYQEAWDGDCKATSMDSVRIGWDKYWTMTGGARGPLANKLPGGAPATVNIPEWDLLTTRKGSSGTCGYRERRILISVQPKVAGETLQCAFEFDDTRSVRIIPKDGANACTLYAGLASNKEVPFGVRLVDRKTGATRVVTAIVPEDVLIVSLGDSFASGEGNPDVPKGFFDTAVWMDARCHRSAYAGPLRAAMRILNSTGTIDNPRYKHSLSAGAITAVSFACSGALVSQGLNGDYDGVVTLDKALKEYPSLAQTQERRGDQFGSATPIAPQFTQLLDLLGNQGKDPKKNIDLMVLGGGGNDVEFGALVTAMVARNIAADSLQSAIQTSLNNHFTFLKGSFTNFHNSWRNLDQNYRVSQTVILQYPDPLFKNDRDDCVGHIEQDSAKLGLLNPILQFFGFFGQLSITKEEIAFVRSNVIGPLNKMVAAQTIPHTNGWLVIDATKSSTDDVRNHGWCLGGVAGPYEQQARWFRSVNDSIRIQGNANGSFHPTFELTDKIQGALIAEAFVQGVNLEPIWDQVKVKSAIKREGITFVLPRPIINYEVTGTLLPKLSSGALSVLACRVNATDCQPLELTAHGATVELDGSALSAKTKRIYEREKLLRLQVDAEAPKISCSADNGASFLPCSSLRWVKNRVMMIRASDTDSGIADASLSFATQTGSKESIKFRRESDSVWTSEVAFMGDGDYKLEVCATDTVGNSTGTASNCEQTIEVGVDTKGFAVAALLAHGIDWSGNARNKVPTIPIFGDVLPNASARFEPKAAPVNCVLQAGACTLPLKAAYAPWLRAIHSENISDAAANTTNFLFATVRVRDFDRTVKTRDVTQWKAETALPTLVPTLRTALWLEPDMLSFIDKNSPGLANALETVLDEQADPIQAQRAAKQVLGKVRNSDLLVKWLNLLNGATYANQPISSMVSSRCGAQVSPQGSNRTQLQWLHAEVRCAVAADALRTAGHP